MDFVKKAADGLRNNGATGGQAGGQPAADNGQQDYVDKAFSAAAQKSGHNLDRNTQEKITDGGRNAYEKATGSKVNPKISN